MTTTNVSPMAISRLLSPTTTTTNNHNNTNINVPPSLPAKRGRGRPRKYANEEEQREARRAQILQSVRKYRQKQAETRASASESTGSEGAGKSKSPSEHGGQGEERDRVGNVQGASQVQMVRGANVNVRPNMLEAPAVEDAVLSMLDRKMVDGHDDDDYGVSQAQSLIDETGGFERRVEHDEAPEQVEVSLAVVRKPKQPERRILPRSASSPSATDLHMNNTALFLDGLLRDFMTFTQNSETWWPFAATTRLPGLAGQLVGRSHIAACAATIGIARKDLKLIKLGEAANIGTIRALRQYTNDAHIKDLAVGLIISIHSLINYEFKEFARGVESLPNTKTWALHVAASNTIAQQAGPDAFRSGLGSRILLGLLPQSVITATGLRTNIPYTTPSWLRMLESLHFPSFKESIWPLGVHVPELMHHYDIIMSSSSSACTSNIPSLAATATAITIASFQDLHARVTQLSDSLDRWLSLFPDGKYSRPGLKLYSTSTTRTSGTEGDPFHPRVTFPHICAAQVTALYWTLKLLLSILAADIHGRLSLLCLAAAHRLPTHTNPSTYAYLICRSHAYFTVGHTLSSSTVANCVSWPLRVAWCWFAKEGFERREERAWCEEASRGLRRDPVGRVGEYLVDFGWKVPIVGPESMRLETEREGKWIGF